MCVKCSLHQRMLAAKSLRVHTTEGIGETLKELYPPVPECTTPGTIFQLIDKLEERFS